MWLGSLATLQIYPSFLHKFCVIFATDGETSKSTGYATTQAITYAISQIFTKPSTKPRFRYVSINDIINAIIADIIKVKTYL